MPATVDASRSDPDRQEGNRPPSWWEAMSALGPSERLAALGALICVVATVLPWYRAPIDNLVKTGLGVFGFAEAALLIIGGAALALLLEVGRGRRPPLPLHEGTLLAAAGGWAGMIVLYLMFDRPEFQLAGFSQDYSLAYGIFVALGGAVLLAVAGLRIRRTEMVAERARR
jgi:hypothetical protein